MNTYKKVLRTIMCVVFYFTALAMFVTLIYFFSDFESNVELNMYVDDYTITFIALMVVVFLALGTLELMLLKKGKNEQTDIKK